MLAVGMPSYGSERLVSMTEQEHRCDGQMYGKSETVAAFVFQDTWASDQDGGVRAGTIRAERKALQVLRCAVAVCYLPLDLLEAGPQEEGVLVHGFGSPGKGSTWQQQGTPADSGYAQHKHVTCAGDC